MILIFDLDHMSSAHYMCKSFASSFTTLVLLFQEHYPLVLKKILIIRAPEMARVAFNAMTPFLNDIIQVISLSVMIFINEFCIYFSFQLCILLIIRLGLTDWNAKAFLSLFSFRCLSYLGVRVLCSENLFQPFRILLEPCCFL